MIALRQILVATDFGEAAENALAYGREFARRFGATLHVLNVVDDTAARMMVATGIPYNQLPPDADLAGAAEHLDSLLTAQDRRELRVEVATVLGTSPAKEITEYAKRFHVDLIILGTHGRGPVGHLIMGSVAEHVVRAASCPVLTVHAHEREFIQPDALQTVGRAAR